MNAPQNWRADYTRLEQLDRQLYLDTIHAAQALALNLPFDDLTIGAKASIEQLAVRVALRAYEAGGEAKHEEIMRDIDDGSYAP